MGLQRYVLFDVYNKRISLKVRIVKTPQKGHMIYIKNAKSHISASKRRKPAIGEATAGKPTGLKERRQPSARSWRSEQRVPRQTIGGGYTIAQDCGKVKRPPSFFTG